jgi:hypothetical protein
MSTPPMPMVQVFAPDGTLGDIPYDKLHDALSAGAKVARKVQAPDGTPGYVPADRINEALKAGAKPVALDLSDADGGKKDGYWSKLTAPTNPAVANSNAVVRGLDAAGGAFLGTPQALYNMVRHPVDTATGLAQSIKGAVSGYADPNLTANAVKSVLPEALGQGIGSVSGGEAAGVAGAAAPRGIRAGVQALPGAESIATALRTPEGKLIPPVKVGSQVAGMAAGHAIGIPGAGELGGYLVGDKLANMLIPQRADVLKAAQRAIEEKDAAGINRAIKMQDAYNARVAKQTASLKDLTGVGPGGGVTVVPEPRAFSPGDVNLMGSVPRGTLQDLALTGKPGAGAQLQHLGQPVLYAPLGAGISNVKSAVALRDLLEAKPNMTLNPVGAGGARQIVPGNEFESLFGPEHKEVGDLAEWETGNREGVKVGSDLDKAAKSMFGGKSFDALTQAQKAHILRIAQTQVAVP